MKKRAFLIFSGHNDRAVLALCRFFSQRQYEFFIVASGAKDGIFQTPWHAQVILVRQDKSVDVQLFKKIRQSAPEVETLVYCPTTEYINHFILTYRPYLENLGFDFLLPQADVYHGLSNKKSSLHIIQTLGQLQAPRAMAWGDVISPCVFKPKANISDGAVHYPALCFEDAEVQEKYATLNPEHWFVQQYIQGQSHYLCGYLSRQGAYAAYWQINLMQQAGGKSIVLAKTGKNPGFDEAVFFQQLAALQYHGPLMMEVIEDADGQLFYIEINPRFWGPLQLAVDACPQMLDLFAADAGFTSPEAAAPVGPCASDGEHWYAWAAGAQTPGCRIYPAAHAWQTAELQSLIAQFDVYRN